MWFDRDPVLRLGEPGYETDTGLLKIGDGVLRYSVLPYFDSRGLDDPDSLELILEHISSPTPHSVYDNGPSLELLYNNAKV